jgi:hypothetical protein
MSLAADRCNYLSNMLPRGYSLSCYPYMVLTNRVIVVTKGYTPSKGLRFWPKMDPSTVNVEILYTRCFYRGIGTLLKGLGLGKSTHTDVTVSNLPSFGQNRHIKCNGKSHNPLFFYAGRKIFRKKIDFSVKYSVGWSIRLVSRTHQLFKGGIT